MSNRAVILVLALALFFGTQLAAASDAFMAYRSNTNQSFCTAATALNCPKIKFWNSTGSGTWGPEIELPSAGSPVREAVIKASPLSTKMVLVTQSDDGNLDAYVCMTNCNSAGNWVVTNDIGSVWTSAPATHSRRFDVEFETATGRALVVYGVNDPNTTHDLAYKILPSLSTSFTGITEQYIDDTITTGGHGGTSDLQYTWVELDRKPVSTSSELIVAGFDFNDSAFEAWVWNGGSWGNQQQLIGGATGTGQREDLAVKYVSDGSKGMVVAGGLATTGASSKRFEWQFWNGSTWSAATAQDVTPANGVVPMWLTLKANPSNNDLQLVAVDTNPGLDTSYWNGSSLSWTSTTGIDASIDASSTRPADFEWEPTGSTGRLVWDTDLAGTTLSQRLCNPQCTGTINTTSTYAGTGAWLAMYRNPTSTDSVKILGGRLNTVPNLGSFSWNGAAYTNYGDTAITSAPGSSSFESFTMAFGLSSVSPVVNTCRVISSPGQYLQTANLAGAPNPGASVAINACVLINSNNVLFDCNGFSITNNGTAGSTTAILIEAANNVTVQNCPGLSQYTHGLYVQASNNSLITNVTAFNDSILGISAVSSRNDTFSGNTVRNSTAGIDLSGSNNNTLIGNNVFNITNTGISLSSSSTANVVTANTVSNSSTGFELNNVSNNDLTSNNANNDQTGYMLDFGSSGNRLNINNATLSSYGFLLSNASGNNLTNNFVNVSATAFYLSLSSSNRLIGDNSTGATNEGFFLITNSNSNTLTNDNAVNGVNRGFRFQDGSNSNILTNVFASNNGDTNYMLLDSNGNSLNGFVSNNGTIGVLVQDSNSTLLTSGIVANSTSYGLQIVDSNGTVISAGRTYNNNPDFVIGDVFLSVPVSLSLSNVFDSPAGTITNYTNLSVTDSVENGTGYSMNWSAPVLPLPLSHNSFAQKFLNITNLTAGVSIDSVVWRWLDTEAGASFETNFQLWKFGSSGWVMVNGTPDTAGNTLSLANQNNFSVFAILILNDTLPPNVTLNAPPNGSVINSSTVNFNFTAADDISTTMNCSLFVDGVLSGNNASTANNTPTVIPVSGVQMGNHTWNVTCKDNAGNTGASETRNFFVTAVSSCPIITVPGSYTQVANLLGAPNPVGTPAQSGFSSVCVKIAASNTLYNCNGFNITDNGVNNAMGVYLNGSLTNVTLENCGISQYKRGATIFGTNNSIFLNNSVFNNSQDGMHLDSSFNNSIIGNDFFFNGQNGIQVDSGSTHAFINNTAHNNSQAGIFVLTSPNNFVVNNTAFGNANDGIHIASSDNNMIANNTLLNNKQDGVQVVQNTNNSFISNNATGNQQHGLHIVGTTTNLFRDNLAFQNSQSGLLSASSTNSLFINNTALNNGQSGFDFAASDFDTMINNTAANHPQNGLLIDDSNNTNLVTNHYYNNTADFRMNSASMKVVNTTFDVFDRPSDGFQNYTNLSISDAEVSSTYTVTWSPKPAPLPFGCPAFAALTTGEKFVNITNVTGNVSIDTAAWSWTDAEAAPYNESMFVLAKYNGSWSAVPNQTLNTAANNITVTSLNSFGVFGILLCNDSMSALKADQTALQPSPGGVVQFNITLTDTGNTTLNPLTAVDTLPAGLTFLSASPAPDNVAGQVVTWNNVGPISPAGTVVLYVNATVDAGVVNASIPTATFTNNVSTGGVDPIGINVTANSSANVTVFYANVSIIKLNQTALQPSPGGIVQFNLTVTNTGNVTLNPTQVIDVLPAGLTFDSASQVPSSVVGQTITWNNASSLAPGASAVLYLNATVDAGTVNSTTPTLTLQNCANATGVPPNGFNVSAQSCANVTVFYANVSIVKVDITPVLTSPGGTVQWQINVSNPGQVALDPVMVVDVLPFGFQYSASSPPADSVTNGNRTVTWNNVGPIAPGGFTTVLLNSTVNANTVNGTYTNSVNVTGTPPNGDNVSASDTAQVGIFAPAINVVKSVNQTNTSINKNVTYTINVSNTGSINETVTIVDSLPSNMTFLGADVPPTSNSSGVVTWVNVTNLPPGGWFVIHYIAIVGKNGTFINNVTATGTPPNGNNVSDNGTAVLVVNPFPSIPPGGGGGSKTMTLSLGSSCSGNVISITDSGGPLSGVHVSVNGGSAFVGLTNGSGQVAFPGCDLNISAHATETGYLPGNLNGQSVSCLSCVPQCTNDSGCAGTQQCISGQCKPVNCPNGTVVDHKCVVPPKNQTQCVAPGCCTADAECLANQACVTPTGLPASPAAPGSCLNVTGQCGTAVNHTFVPFGYQCGSEPGCPACPQGLVCMDHLCIARNITCPANGFIGSNQTCHATENNASCRFCDLNITRPDGVTSQGRTDGAGNFTLQLVVTGVYNISILGNGAALRSVQITALPVAAPEEQPKQTIMDICPWPLWILLILVILAAIIYWRSRQKEQPKKPEGTKKAK